MECFIINCWIIRWLIKYFTLSVLKLTVCHRSGGNGLDWVFKIGPTYNSGPNVGPLCHDSAPEAAYAACSVI